MRNKFYWFCLLIALILIGVFTFYYRNQIIVSLEKPVANSIISSERPLSTVFSFQKPNVIDPISACNHYTLSLTSLKNWDIEKEKWNKILDDSLPLIITIHTWGGNPKNAKRHRPLNKIINGKFDAVFSSLCKTIEKKSEQIYIRINPEMEVPSTRFSWQKNRIAYQDAFCYMSAFFRKRLPNVNIMWAPAGYPGVMEFYPGNEWVDAVSITLKSNSEQELDAYPFDYSLEYELFRRLHRLRFLKQPIFVFGSDKIAVETIDTTCINSVKATIDQERSVIYSLDNSTEILRNKRQYNSTLIGLYDPHELLVNENQISVEHLFVDFTNLNDGRFEIALNKVLQRKHDVIVSFEPFRPPEGETDTAVLSNITNGIYDDEINHFYRLIKKADQQIYLRYAHEMEIPIHRYPWQSKNPIDYIHSFRYFMQYHDSLPKNIVKVWGPAGDRGSVEWYPGDDVVDYISIAIYGLPDKNITDPEKQESFEQIFNRKTWRLRHINKPLFITEFGVKGPESYQTKWMINAAKTIRKKGTVYGINYFNMTDTPKAWGDIKPPDWSITTNTLNKFITTLNGKNQKR